MKKVLFLCNIEIHLICFHIPFMKYFQQLGYEVHIATFLGKRKEELEKEGFVCHPICFSRSPYSLDNIRALKQLMSLMREYEFTLVHVHTPVAAFLGRLAACITRTKPVLYTAHGFHFYKGAPLLNWMIYYPMERLAARWTDGLITMNEEDEQRATNFPLRKGGKTYKVHGVGIPIESYVVRNKGPRKELRKDLGYDEEDLLLITVAELSKRKNQFQIIRALKEVVNQVSSVYLLLVGDGPAQDELEELVRSLQLEDHVQFLGYRTDTAELLNASDIGILTSFHEGLPRFVMEVMAAGKPIIATDVRGNRDLIRNEVNGYLIPLNETKSLAEVIIELTKDEAKRKCMGQKGIEVIQDYDMGNVLKEMQDIYEQYL